MTTQVHPLQESFNAGEFGARMHARVQFDKYQNAGATYQNILPIPQGGWTFRPGFRHIASAKSASVRPWLIPFVFSTTQAYILELGETAMRFFRNQGQITAPDTDAAITNGAFGSDITGWTDNSNGTGSIAHDATNSDMNLVGVGSGNEAIATQSVTTSNTGTQHVIKFKVVGDAGDEIIVRVGSASGGASADYLSDAKKHTGWHTIEFTPSASPFYLSFENQQNKTISIDDVAVIDNTAVEIPTPWSESDLPSLSYAQSADVIYFCIGGSIRPYRLERFGNSSWSLEDVLLKDGPWLDLNTSATTLTLSATSGNSINVTASSTTGINDDQGWLSTDVGRLIRWKDPAGDFTWMQITSRTSSTVVVADIKGPNASATTATANWRLGKYNDADGWPSVVGFVQQRLGFAATTTYPQTFWLSKSADIENFQDEDVDGNVQDDSAIDFTFAALQVNTIRWLASRKKPIIGTQGGNWTLRSDGATLTPTDINADFEVSGGAARVQPLEVRNRLVFAQAQARKLLEFADVLQDNGVQGFDSFDLTILNDRVLTGGTTQLAYQQEPDSVIWSVRADGQAPTLTYQPEQSVIGWARQIHGGSFEGGDAIIESVATIPGQDGSGQFKDSSGRHEVWIAVKQKINGSTVRYIECLEKMFDAEEDLQEEAFYVDSGLSLDAPIDITAVTQANPAVVTAASHGFSDGDLVRIVRVTGMTELNTNTYKIAETTTNTMELAAIDGSAITAATKANPGQLTIPSHGLSNSDEIHIHDVGGMTELNGNGYTVTVVDSDNVTIGVDTSGFTTYTSGGTAHTVTNSTGFTAYASSGEVRKKVSTVSGLSHLEGETVQVFADGAVQNDKTVSSGSITLDDAASVVHVGLEYERRFKSLKLSYGSQSGSGVGQEKNVGDVILVLMETAEGALSVATEDEDGEGTFTELDLRDATNVDGDPVPFFTGEKKLGVSAGHDEDLRLVIKGTAPVPATVLGISPELDVAG